MVSSLIRVNKNDSPFALKEIDGSAKGAKSSLVDHQRPDTMTTKQI